MNMSNLAYIMRGVPGSGKSTVANYLAGSEGVIHSTDDYFIVHGEYKYESARLYEYHRKNLAAFRDSISKAVPVVICDNTNIKYSDYKEYVEAAKEADYIVAIVVMPHPDPAVAADRSTHNVPEQAIKRMMEEWEK